MSTNNEGTNPSQHKWQADFTVALFETPNSKKKKAQNSAKSFQYQIFRVLICANNSKQHLIVQFYPKFLQHW